MATDSIKELIIKDIVAAIKNVKKANGYVNSIPDNLVERGKTEVDTNEMPLVLVYEGEEVVVENEYGASLSVIQDLPVVVELWYADYENLSESINSYEADIIKAVMVDNDRGGYAMCTTRAGSVPFFYQDEKPMGGRDIMFTVRYESLENDPYSQ